MSDAPVEAPISEAPATEQVTETAPVEESQIESDSGGVNPSWKPLLDKLPPEFHNLITPDLKKWDQNFTTKTQEVQSKFDPYSEFADNEVDPENIRTALQIMSIIEQDPKAFHEKMGDYYKDQWGQGQEEAPPVEEEISLDDPEYDITQHPKFKELMGNQETMATYMAQKIQQEEDAKAEAALDVEEKRLIEKYGEFDLEYVYTKATNGMDFEEAVKAYHAMVDKIRSQPRANDSAPPVFNPSGGGTPSSQPDPGKMTGGERQRLVEEILQRANKS